MSLEENPPENLSHSPADGTDDSIEPGNQDPTGDGAPTGATEGDENTVKQLLMSSTPPLARNMENLAAKGGAIGAVVLGTMCITGSFLTNFSMINGVMGLIMGVWGLRSQKRRTTWIGIGLCVVGIALCVLNISEIVTDYMKTTDENDF